MFLAIAHLPNASVGKLPVLADPVKTSADLYPNVVGGRADVLVGQIKRIHELAVDVCLVLRNGFIADTHRAGPSIAFPVIQCLLAKFVVAAIVKRTAPAAFGRRCLDARSSSQRMKAAASSLNPMRRNAYTVKAASRIHV